MGPNERLDATSNVENNNFASVEDSNDANVIDDHKYFQRPSAAVNLEEDPIPMESDTETDEILNADTYTNEAMENEHNYCFDVEKPNALHFSPKSGVLFAVEQNEKLKAECDRLEKENESLRLELYRTPITRMRYECIEGNDKNVHLFTGFPGCKYFTWLYDCIKDKIERLHYYKGEASCHYLNDKMGNKRGPPRALDSKSQMLMTFMKLKLNLTEEDLAFRFEVSVPHVSCILSTYILFLASEMKHAIVWPTVDALGAYYPKCFQSFGKVLSIIDCTEMYAQKPSLASSNSKMFSAYKNQTTVKFLVGCTPSGSISFVSNACSGSMSDREIVMKSGFIDYVKKTYELNDERLVILADRGFNIQDLLLPYNVRVVIPPFLRGKSQFSEKENQKTKSVASSRIHIERVIGRIKTFKFLQYTIPSEFFDLLDQIIVICCAVINLHKPIIPCK